MRRLLYNKRLTSWAQKLRGALTPTERKLWYQFLNDQLVRWMRQRSIGQYIADFYCASFKLIVAMVSPRCKRGGLTSIARVSSAFSRLFMSAFPDPTRTVPRQLFLASLVWRKTRAYKTCGRANC